VAPKVNTTTIWVPVPVAITVPAARKAAAGCQEEDCQENQNSSLHDFQFSGLGDLLASMGNGTFDTFSLKIRARLKAYSDV
jgi:hypothetical protein